MTTAILNGHTIRVVHTIVGTTPTIRFRLEDVMKALALNTNDLPADVRRYALPGALITPEALEELIDKFAPSFTTTTTFEQWLADIERNTKTLDEFKATLNPKVVSAAKEKANKILDDFVGGGEK